MALQPQGPMAEQDHLTDLIFSNPDDEIARSAFPLQSPCEQCHTGVSAWLQKFLATTNVPTPKMPVRVPCKTGFTSARLVFETRAKCQDFVTRLKDDGLPYAVGYPFCNTSATILVRQSNSPEDREIGKCFAPLLKVVYKVTSNGR